MNTAYDAYRIAAARYSTASSNYSYYASRCHWTRPADCSRAAYWSSVRSFWSTQRSITYGVYVAATKLVMLVDEEEESLEVVLFLIREAQAADRQRRIQHGMRHDSLAVEIEDIRERGEPAVVHVWRRASDVT